MRALLLLFILALPVLAEAFLSKPLNLRAVVPGKVYRSTDLCVLTPEQDTTLKALGLRTIIDLRSEPEVKSFGPDRPVAAKVVSISLPPLAGAEGYQEYVREKKVFGQLFHLLAQESTYPVLFHCHRGKDRTGVLAALLEDLLGVPREEVYLNYLQSTQVGPGPENDVQREWLDVVFDAVDKAGGIKPYLESCGVTAEEQARLVTILTKTPDK